MTANAVLRLTLADLEAMPDDGSRYELIDGDMHVSTAPGFFHQSALARLTIAIGKYLEQHPPGDTLPGPGVIFDDQNAVIPDLLFLTVERRRRILEGGRLVAAPEIAIEIVSPGHANERRDRHVKLKLCSERGVNEYWIADPENHSVEIYRRADGDSLARAVF